jgi:hypothetical protein
MTLNPMPPATPPKPPIPAEAKLAIFGEELTSHRLSQRSVTISGRTYRLFLATPAAAAPAEGFPILHALDGNAVFDLLTADLLAEVPGLAIAGIGHDTPLRFDPAMRSLDYTPASDGRGVRPDPGRPDRMIGGADDMLDRLCGPLRAEIEAELPVDAGRRTIFGHSLAGLFVVYALLMRPEAFGRFAAASPSIWWGDELLLGMEAAMRPAFRGQSVLITLGDSERRSSPNGPHWDGPAPHTLEMVRRLEKRPGLNVASLVLDGLGHAATLPASLPHALRFAATGEFPAETAGFAGDDQGQ